jgi:hypothetical protein
VISIGFIRRRRTFYCSVSLISWFSLIDYKELEYKKENNMQMISKRSEEITPFFVLDILERAHEMERQGIHIIHLNVGHFRYISCHMGPVFNNY